MNIAITFRHLEASDAIKAYATEKIAKLQKFLRAPMRARVTLSLEDKSHGCEVEVNAGSGHFVASEWGEDMYASIDKVLAKLERQITGAHSSNVTRRKGADSARDFAVAMAETAPPSRPVGELIAALDAAPPPAASGVMATGAGEAAPATMLAAASGDEG
ncbi:MAG TPA: ribosome-associated translation inhibitor RaiA [Polyangiaceae bacterium]|nr:ribosome-associated translation inhibitor RaiA [Polyangiaceae bacterium]